jgi:hypothetical protein
VEKLKRERRKFLCLMEHSECAPRSAWARRFGLAAERMLSCCFSFPVHSWDTCKAGHGDRQHLAAVFSVMPFGHLLYIGDQ